MRIFARVFAGSVALFVLCITAAVFYVQSLDLSSYNDALAERLSETLGHTVSIRGPLKLVLKPDVSLLAEDVVVLTSDTKTATKLASIKEIDVAVKPSALLAGRIEARSMTLIGVRVWLEPNVRDNQWFSAAPSDHSSSPPAVQLRDARLHIGTGDSAFIISITEFEGQAGKETSFEGKLKVKITASHGTFFRTPALIEGQLEVDQNSGFSLTNARMQYGEWLATGRAQVSLDGGKPTINGTFRVPRFISVPWCDDTLGSNQIASGPFPPLEGLRDWNLDLALTFEDTTILGADRGTAAEVRLTLQDGTADVHLQWTKLNAHIALLPPPLVGGETRITANVRGQDTPPSSLFCASNIAVANHIGDYHVELKTRALTVSDLLQNLSGSVRATLTQDQESLALRATLSDGKVQHYRLTPVGGGTTLEIIGQTGPLIELIRGGLSLTGVLRTPRGATVRFDGRVKDGTMSGTAKIKANFSGKDNVETLAFSAGVEVRYGHLQADFRQGVFAGSVISGNANASYAAGRLRLKGKLILEALDVEKLDGISFGENEGGEVMPLDLDMALSIGELSGTPIVVKNAAARIRSEPSGNWYADLGFDAIGARWAGEFKLKNSPTTSHLALTARTESVSGPAASGITLKDVEVTANAKRGRLTQNFDSFAVGLSAKSGIWRSENWPGKISIGQVHGKYDAGTGFQLESPHLKLLRHSFRGTLSASRKKSGWSGRLLVKGALGQLKVWGHTPEGYSLPKSRWKFTAEGPSVTALGRGLDFGDLPDAFKGPFALSGKANFLEPPQGLAVVLDELALALGSIGNLSGQGKLAIEGAGPGGGFMQLTLDSDGLILPPSNGALPVASKNLLPDLPLPSSLAFNTELDITLNAAAIRHPAQTLKGVRANWRLRRERLDASINVGTVGAGGTLEAQVNAHSANTRGLKWEFQVGANEADLGWLLPQADYDHPPTAWPVDLEFRLVGRGTTLAEVLATGTGRVYFAGDETSRGADDLERWETNLLTLLLPRAGPPRRQKLNCAVLDGLIAQGTARTTAFLVDTDAVTVAGEGSLALDTEELNFAVSPKPKGLSLLDVATPVRIRGPLIAPKFSIAAPDLVLTAGKTLLSFFSPYGLLAGLVSNIGGPSGDGERNVCQVALDQARNAINQKGADVHVSRSSLPSDRAQ